MLDLCVAYTFAGMTLNDQLPYNRTVSFMFDGEGCSGFDGAPLRRQLDPNGAGIDGGIVHDAPYGPRILNFKMAFRAAEADGEPAYSATFLDALNEYKADLVAALESKRNTAADLVWTPTGLTAHTLSCKYGIVDGELKWTGPMIAQVCTFTLVAASPAISVA